MESDLLLLKARAMVALSAIITDAEARKRFEVIGKYLLSQEEYAVFLMEDDLSPDARFKYEYSLTLIVRVSVFWLLRDLEQGTADVERLAELAQAYYDHPRRLEDMVRVRLSDSVVLRLKKIGEHFGRVGIEVKPKTKRGVPNRQMPLNVAVWYAYERVKP